MKPKLKNAIPVLAKLAADHAALELSEDALRERRKIARNEFRRWYLVTIESRRENTVRAHLIGRGVRVFVPEMRGFKRGSRQPMFPGYGFAYLDYEVEWSIVTSRPGVIGIHHGVVSGKPTVVPHDVIEAVSLVERDELSGKVRGLMTNDPVRVAAGPLHGFRGKFLEFDGAGRIRVLLDVLGRWSVVELDQSEVIAI
jgi:transcription antitermination factor NusG